MRLVFSALVTIISLAAPIHARSEKVLLGAAPQWAVASDLMPVPENPQGLVFVRRQDTQIHLDKDGQAQYVGYRIKLLHANALQLGNITLAWNPDMGAATVHSIKVYRGSEEIDVLKNSSFEVLRREGQLEAAVLDGILTASLRIPDLRVDDELEVSVTTRAKDPTMGLNDAGILALLPDPAPGRFRLKLSWADGHKPNIKMTPDMEPLAEQTQQALTLGFDNPKSMPLPKDAPARYSWQRAVEYSDFAQWSQISKHFAPLFAKAATLAEASPLRGEVKRIEAAHSSAIDRAAAALKLVQQDVRYIYVGLNGGNFMPATAEETWKRRYGDCKGKTALLIALLTQMGIEAEAVLANNRGADDGMDERLPSPNLFDHVLVRAQIDGKTYWMDGTLPPVIAPDMEPALPYRWVLPLSASGKELEARKWKPSARPSELTLYTIDAREGFSEAAPTTSTTITRGITGLQQYFSFSGLTQEQLLNAFRQNAIGDTWQTIDDANWRYDAKAQASILTIKGQGIVGWEDEGNGTKSLVLPGGGFSPPPRRVRSPDQQQDVPFYNAPEYSCYVTTVRLPTSTEQKHWSHNSTFDTLIFGRNYYRAFELRDNAVRMIRGSRIEKTEIDAASAKSENERIASFDNSKAYIEYDPLRRKAMKHDGEPVPTTDEIDWTADDVPCLSGKAPLVTVAIDPVDARGGE
jgi:hypothetical protein